jgi:cytochrome c biogenesis protein CcmG/thiol:disulfide interchange protein DsbE
MKSRWIAVAAVVVGLGLIAVPVFLRSGPDEAGTRATARPDLVASHAPTGENGCETKPTNLDFTVKDMNGADVHLADYRGKVLIVNYWATWCGPCKAEIPEFIDLYNEYKDDGLVILGVSADDDAETLRTFAGEMHMNYPVLVGKDHEDLLDAFGPLVGYPTSFFVGRDGAVCGTHLGPGTKEDFEKTVKALL